MRWWCAVCDILAAFYSLIRPPTASYSLLKHELTPPSFCFKLDASKSEHNVFRAFVLAFLLARPCFLTFLLKNDITTAAPWTTDTVRVRECGPRRGMQ